MKMPGSVTAGSLLFFCDYLPGVFTAVLHLVPQEVSELVKGVWLAQQCVRKSQRLGRTEGHSYSTWWGVGWKG